MDVKSKDRVEELMPDTAAQNDVPAVVRPRSRPRPTPAARQNVGASVTPSDLLRIAMDQGADLDRLERLMDMHERWLKRDAEMAFIDAMIEFKTDAPRITKNQTADFMGKNGRVVYDFSDLGNVVNAVLALLAAKGFSHSWVPDQSITGKLTITCVLTHRMGHKEIRTLSAVHDESGGKNVIQGLGSTASYLERYTLLMACGLAVEGADDDARGAGQQADAPVAADWVAKANAAPNKSELEKVWNAGEPKFRAVGDIDGLNQLVDACNVRATEIAAAAGPGGANKPSRLRDIVGSHQQPEKKA